jgi:hypothetical protein
LRSSDEERKFVVQKRIFIILVDAYKRAEKNEGTGRVLGSGRIPRPISNI